MLNVYNNGNLLPPCLVPTCLGVKLDRSLTFCHHPKALRKKLSTRVSLLRRHARSGCGAGVKTLRISALFLVYSTAEYCAPVWCRSPPIRSDTLHRGIHDPEQVLHGQLVWQQDAHLGRLRSRLPLVPAAWKLLGSLSKLDIRVKQWTKYK